MSKGRKAGFRNKTQVERIIDAVVTASGGSHEDTVNMLSAHYSTEQQRAKTPRGPVREEFAAGNMLNDKYLESFGLTNETVVDSLTRLVHGTAKSNVPGAWEL